MEAIERNTGRIIRTEPPENYSSSSLIARPGQVLYGRLRPYLNKVFMPTQECFVSREFIPLQPLDGLSGKFLFHKISSADFVEFAIGLNSGDRPRVKWQQMAAYLMPLPPLPEQERIVEILEEQFSRLNSALASVKAVREKAQAFRRSLLHAAFNGELTGGTKGWREVALGELTTIRYGKSLDKSMRSDAGRYPVVGSAGVMTKTATPLVSEPCVVVGRKGNVGAVQFFPTGCYPIDTVYYFIAPEAVDTNFLTLTLEGKKLQDLDSSTAIPSLRRDDLESVQVAYPTLAEQERIVEILEAQFSRLDNAVEVANQLEARIAAERRSLLHSAFTGELTAKWRATHV